MAKLLIFAGIGYGSPVKELRSNDPGLTANGDDFIFASAIAVSGNWELFSEVHYGGDRADLRYDGGPDTDGTYKDPVDFESSAPFHVRSVRFSE